MCFLWLFKQNSVRLDVSKCWHLLYLSVCFVWLVSSVSSISMSFLFRPFRFLCFGMFDRIGALRFPSCRFPYVVSFSRPSFIAIGVILITHNLTLSPTLGLVSFVCWIKEE